MESLEPLRVFLHLADTLNFGRTSVERHLSPATLTRTVQRLETQVGRRLFDRGPRGVALTDEGRRFADYARQAVALWEQYREAGRDEVGLSGTLRIFSSVTAGQAILPDLLAPFRRAHPQVRLELQTGDAAGAIGRLDEGAVDVTVAALSARVPEHLASLPVAETPLVCVVAHTARALRAAAQAGDWAAVPFVLPRGGLARDAARRWLRRRRLDPAIAAEVDGHEALLTLVSLGIGAGVVPQLVLETSAVKDRLSVVPVEPPIGTFVIGLCARRIDLRRPILSALWASVVAARPGG
ncbi:HTH-type transcriptional activator IlvY [Dactylosporangium sp. NPDC000555]|uniref:HTH-type transcriptional activator IlvY n=1 Tax=Dactylosporangium sp. NPDC000555 TaxID=3154260 RepID=UPI0033305A08